jgi:hypothetical protein
MTQTDHMAALSRREYREVGKRRAKDAVLFVMKRLMEELAYPMRARKSFILSGIISCIEETTPSQNHAHGITSANLMVVPSSGEAFCPLQ